MEAWRAAATRWGDTLFELALLMTNRRVAAETATVSAFCRVFADPPSTHLEQALYSALLQQQPRWRQPLRDRVLPRTLTRIEPIDRVLLGLWLLRNVDGEAMAAIVGQPAQAVVARLVDVLLCTTNIPRADTVADGDHLTLAQWLEAEFGLRPPAHTHIRICPRCRAAQASWQRAIETLRATLLEILKKEHLPQTCVDAIEDRLLMQQFAGTQRWWQDRRVWIPAFFGGIALLLAVLVVPWNGRDSLSTAAPASAHVLVQEALDAWTTLPVTGTLHRQVWAIDPRLQTSDPLITDLWLGAADTGQHRVEVRRNNQLVEWQIADGKGRLDYAGQPAFSSCPWRTDASAMFRMLDQEALTFRITPEQQRTVREARLLQGAYGTGYAALQRALSANDLRSFGVRRENQRSFVMLSYTDRQAVPPRQILLRIDPVTKHVFGVQEVTLGSGQTSTRDLWRLQIHEEVQTGISAGLPRWPQSATRDTLFDATCPALNPRNVVSLSTLAGDSQPWHLPRSLPQGITRAALLTLNPIVTYIDYTPLGVPRESVATFLGQDRWLSISDLDLHVTNQPATRLERGPWLVDVNRQPRPGVWSITLRLAQERGDPYGRSIFLYAGGWTQDELLAMIDTLRPFDPQVWIDLDAAFLDARPLPPSVYERIKGALTTLKPQPDGTLYSETRTTVRVNPVWLNLSDPFHLPETIRTPETVIRKQWQVYRDSELTSFRDITSLPDDTPYTVQTRDRTQFKLYTSVDGRVYSRSANISSFQQLQPGVEMVRSILRTSDPISILAQDGEWVLQQASPYRYVTMSFEFSDPGLQQTPWTGGLGEGTIVRRLSLDRDSYAPIQFAVLHRDQEGLETPLLITRMMDRRNVDTPEPAALLDIPPLPDDVVTMKVTTSRDVTIEAPASSPITRTLNWRASPEVVIGAERYPGPSADSLSPAVLWQQRWDSFMPSNAWYQTVYHFPPGDFPVTVTQGPRLLMRHILRYQSAQHGWTESHALSVTIAGRDHTAWRLSDSRTAVLVLEVDDLLVHIAGPIDFLEGPVLDHLPQLVWLPVQPDHG
jgi:hypothetical protein